MLRTSLRAAAVLAALLSLAHAGAGAFEARGRHGVVAADHELASEVGVEVLRAGGDAVDAAVATALALGVVNPQSSGLGGGGFLIAWRAKEAKALALDFREVAPAACGRDTFTRPGMVPQMSRVGGLAVGVPGEAAGLGEAHRRWGRLPWARVVAPAERLAREGFPVGPALAATLARIGDRLRLFPDLDRRFRRPDGGLVGVGDRLRRPDLARTLATLASEGAGALYRGRIAREIAAATVRRGGVLTEADLAGYRDLYAMPPPSSGGAVLLAILGTLKAKKALPPARTDPVRVHLLVEAMKHAFADRARWFGDPDFVQVPLDRLLDPGVLRARAGALDARRTWAPAHYGTTAPPTDGGTSHLSVLDAAGNAVALTTTVNTAFGSLVVAGDTGVILNDEMDDFTTRPGEANAFGLQQSELNAVAPGKRPLSSMSPTVVVHDGRPELVVGGSGGPRIITGTLAAILHVVDHGASPGEAVSLPRVHHQWLPDEVVLEPGAVAGDAAALAAFGHRVRPAPPAWSAVQAAGRLPDGTFVGASDPRKHGRAVAW